MQNQQNEKPENLFRCYTHYQDNKNRLWLIVSLPYDMAGNIFLLHVKRYKSGELNEVINMPFLDFLILTEQKKMVHYLPTPPKLVNS